MCAPSSNFPKSFLKILPKQGARGAYCTNTRIADELAAIPDRKFATKGPEQQLFFFFLTDFFVCSQSGYHPWEVAIINERFSQVWLYNKHQINFIFIIFLYFGQVRKFGEFFLFFFIPLQPSGD